MIPLNDIPSELRRLQRAIDRLRRHKHVQGDVHGLLVQFDSIAREGGSSHGHLHADLAGLLADDHLQYAETSRGGNELTHVVADAGPAHTIDPADGNWHDITMTEPCTFSLAAPGHSEGCLLLVDLTGPYAAAWPGSLDWGEAGPPPTPEIGETIGVTLRTRDDGTTWRGWWGGGSAIVNLADTVESEITFGLSAAGGSADTGSRSDHTHGSPGNPVSAASVSGVGRWEPVVHDPGGGPELVFDDGDIVVTFVETP